MPKIRLHDLNHYYEQAGQGPSLVFVHGAFADARIWEPQWQHFSSSHHLLRYDLRGHGRTGASNRDHYCMSTFADDLDALLDALEIASPIVCGLSWGGSIVQAFAVRSPARLKALILAGSAVSIRLTRTDKLLCDVLFPRWAMLLTIKSIRVENFTRFSLWLARLTRGAQWLSRDEAFGEYLKQCMLQMDRREYIKIWEAIYGFNLLPLERITCPTLVLNGAHESSNTFRHTREILRRVPQADSQVIPGACHAMNWENPKGFNEYVEEFLRCCS